MISYLLCLQYCTSYILVYSFKIIPAPLGHKKTHPGSIKTPVVCNETVLPAAKTPTHGKFH